MMPVRALLLFILMAGLPVGCVVNPPVPRTQRIELEHVYAADIAEVLEVLRETPDPVARDFSVRADSAAGSVILTGSAEDIAKAKDLIAELDQPLETKIRSTIELEAGVTPEIKAVLESFLEEEQPEPGMAMSSSRVGSSAAESRLPYRTEVSVTDGDLQVLGKPKRVAQLRSRIEAVQAKARKR